MNYTYTTKHRISRWVWLCLMETVANFWYSFMLMIRSSATVHISLYISASTVALLFAAIMGVLNKSSFFCWWELVVFFFLAFIFTATKRVAGFFLKKRQIRQNFIDEQGYEATEREEDVDPYNLGTLLILSQYWALQSRFPTKEHGRTWKLLVDCQRCC
jgi:hypothetical protein